MLITFLLQQWLHEHVSVLHHAYIACRLVLFSGKQNLFCVWYELVYHLGKHGYWKVLANMIFRQLAKCFGQRNLRVLSCQLFFHMQVLW